MQCQREASPIWGNRPRLSNEHKTIGWYLHDVWRAGDVKRRWWQNSQWDYQHDIGDHRLSQATFTPTFTSTLFLIISCFYYCRGPQTFWDWGPELAAGQTGKFYMKILITVDQPIPLIVMSCHICKSTDWKRGDFRYFVQDCFKINYTSFQLYTILSNFTKYVPILLD